jgi:hypothetical protein
MRQYRLSRVVTGLGQPLFGHPAVETATQSGLPVAYFDWSLGDSEPRPRDLPLDPALSARDIAAALGRWVGDS